MRCETRTGSWPSGPAVAYKAFVIKLSGYLQEVLHALCDKNRKLAKRPSLVPPPHGQHPPAELVALMQRCWHQVPFDLCTIGMFGRTKVMFPAALLLAATWRPHGAVAPVLSALCTRHLSVGLVMVQSMPCWHACVSCCLLEKRQSSKRLFLAKRQPSSKPDCKNLLSCICCPAAAQHHCIGHTVRDIEGGYQMFFYLP